MIKVRSTETGVVFKSKAEAARRTGFTIYKLNKSLNNNTCVTNKEGITDKFKYVDKVEPQQQQTTITDNQQQVLNKAAKAESKDYLSIADNALFNDSLRASTLDLVDKMIAQGRLNELLEYCASLQ